MTSVGVGFKTMKDSVFIPSNESSGLVKALLELDDSPAGSDEEFLDFQFKIADAKAREREASEQLSDWKSAFSNLQLRQAQEIAEFALARRKEDEAYIAQQTSEINELRSSFQASELEIERLKAENTSLLQQKSRVEQEFDHELQYSDTLRQSVNELNHVQERMAAENLELKRALDEATVTTGRLKEALEEKASELSAWLGLDGINLQALPTSVLGEGSSKAEEKKAYDGHFSSHHMPKSNQKIDEGRTQRDSVFEGAQDARCEVKTAPENICPADEECADMKHEISSDGLPRFGEMGARNGNDVCERRKGVSVRDLLAEEREPNGQDLSPRKKERALTLEQKIQELQLELDSLQYQHNHSNVGIDLWVHKQRSCQSSGLAEVAKEDGEQEGRLSSDSSSTTEKAEITGSGQPGLSNEAGTSADHAKRNARSLDVGNCFPGSESFISLTDELDASQSSQTHSVHGDASWVSSRADLEDKHIYTDPNQIWSLKSVSELVESITEELTKLLRVVIKTPSSSLRTSFNDLERRVKMWSNITSKALQSKVSKSGALEEWKDLVVDFLSQSRQELMTLHQRLHDCEDELSSVDKLRAESLIATQTITFLKDEVNKLEAQNFNDHIEREEELNLLKKDLDHAHTLISAAQRKASDEHKTALSLKDQLRKVELELEHSKQGWAAEQDFIDSCSGDRSGGLFEEEKSVSRKDVETLEKRVVDLTTRLEENERELGELMVIIGIDLDAVVTAKFNRMELRLADAKASEGLLQAERSELTSQVNWLKAKLAEVEHELHLENQQHVESLIRYEEEQGQLEATTMAERATLHAKLAHLETLLAEKTRQVESGYGEANVRSHLSKEKDKSVDLESKCRALQSSVVSLKTELSEAEQREKRAQSQIEKLMVELGIAKEEVLKCEVRMQKTLRQAKEDVDAEKRRLEESQNSQKQMEWHLCRQIEMTEGLEREKAKIREVLEEFELQNLALEKERDDLRTAYMQLARQTAQRVGFLCGLFFFKKF